MRNSIEHRNIKYVKGSEFLSFAKNTGAHATKVAKSMSSKYNQKLLDSAIKIYNRCNKNCYKQSNSKKLQKKDNKLLIN